MGDNVSPAHYLIELLRIFEFHKIKMLLHKQFLLIISWLKNKAFLAIDSVFSGTLDKLEPMSFSLSTIYTDATQFFRSSLWLEIALAFKINVRPSNIATCPGKLRTLNVPLKTLILEGYHVAVMLFLISCRVITHKLYKIFYELGIIVIGLSLHIGADFLL